MSTHPRLLAVVTGASSNIGLALARLCVAHGFDLIVTSDGDIHQAVPTLAVDGSQVEAVRADLGTRSGVETLLDQIGARRVDVLMANAAEGRGHAIPAPSFDDTGGGIDSHVTGMLYLTHHIGRQMRAARTGRILLTGAIAGFLPGALQATGNGTQVSVGSFFEAWRNELRDSGVSVTCLLPDPADAHCFGDAGLLDAEVGVGKASPLDVAKAGFDAMMAGESDVVAGWKHRRQAAIASLTPSPVPAERYRTMAEAGRTT